MFFCSRNMLLWILHQRVYRGVRWLHLSHTRSFVIFQLKCVNILQNSRSLDGFIRSACENDDSIKHGITLRGAVWNKLTKQWSLMRSCIHGNYCFSGLGGGLKLLENKSHKQNNRRRSLPFNHFFMEVVLVGTDQGFLRGSSVFTQRHHDKAEKVRGRTGQRGTRVRQRGTNSNRT